MRTLRSLILVVGFPFMASALAACGDTDSVVVVDSLEPFDVTGAIRNSIDVVQGLCRQDNSGNMGTPQCEGEPFGEGFVRVTLRNSLLLPVDPSNPFFGRRRIDAYRVQYQTLNGGPELPSINGRMSVSLDPGEQATFPLILLNAEGQSIVRSTIFTGDPRYAWLYSARYTFGGPDTVDVEGAVNVSFGSYNNCPAMTTAIGGSVCQ